MGNKAKLIVAILVMLAIGLAVAAYVVSAPPPTLRKPSQVAVAPPTSTVAVVVAAKTLSAGVAITANGVKVLRYPEQPVGAYSQVASVLGKVPADNIAPGAPVLQSDFPSGLATQLAPGYVAMAIPIENEVVAVGDHLHPGNRVDLFSILPGNQGQVQGGWPTQSRLLLANLRVLAVGPLTVEHPVPVKSKNSQGDIAAVQGDNATPRSVVLEVPLARANALALASTNSHLLLALRNPDSTTLPDTHGFPTPSPAIVPSKIPVPQRKAFLHKPENRAYAGETLPGLAGKGPAAAAAMHPLPPPPMLQIYEGGKKTAVPY